MTRSDKIEVLFTGHAPIHFLCFRPLYERLVALAGVEVFVSGGLEKKIETGVEYDAEALYEPFGVPRQRVLPVLEIAERHFDALFTANTNAILPGSVGTNIQIFHGLSFRNRAIRPENTGRDFYFMVGAYMHRRFIEAGFLEESDERAVAIGFMKTDRLLNGGLNRSGLLARYGFDGTRPVLLYAPTGEKDNSLETMGEEVIGRLTGSGRFDLLIKPHDHPKRHIDWFARLSRFEGDHCRLVRDFDVVPPLYLADLLISDASSVSNEYSLLDRPMVFLDVPKLIKRARSKNNSRVDLETWGRKCGLVVNQAEHIEEAVEVSLQNPQLHSETRQAMAKDLFYNPGRATDAAVSWLRENLPDSGPVSRWRKSEAAFG